MPEKVDPRSQNSVTHGLNSRIVVQEGEDPAVFDALRLEMLADLAPAGAMQIVLAERLVVTSWRLLRAAGYEGMLRPEASSRAVRVQWNDGAGRPTEGLDPINVPARHDGARGSSAVDVLQAVGGLARYESSLSRRWHADLRLLYEMQGRGIGRPARVRKPAR
ncbi:MAG TPA: hypothetical protein VMQ86_25590 [Bryobacteraceae bacterium]|jgi:hypothetical protein|nr:hypothetical protein [Bryobacteraceae bacterium]